jgi:hypothetical protein
MPLLEVMSGFIILVLNFICIVLTMPRLEVRRVFIILVLDVMCIVYFLISLACKHAQLILSPLPEVHMITSLSPLLYDYCIISPTACCMITKLSPLYDCCVPLSPFRMIAACSYPPFVWLLSYSLFTADDGLPPLIGMICWLLPLDIILSAFVISGGFCGLAFVLTLTEGLSPLDYRKLWIVPLWL